MFGKISDQGFEEGTLRKDRTLLQVLTSSSLFSNLLTHVNKDYFHVRNELHVLHWTTGCLIIKKNNIPVADFLKNLNFILDSAAINVGTSSSKSRIFFTILLIRI